MQLSPVLYIEFKIKQIHNNIKRRLKNLPKVYACTSLTGLSQPTKTKANFTYLKMYRD